MQSSPGVPQALAVLKKVEKHWSISINQMKILILPGLEELGTEGYLSKKSNSTGLISFFISKI
jgi:hypothetical protein